VGLCSGAIGAAVVLASCLYARGRRMMKGASASAIPTRRAAPFLSGMFLVWTALGSPLVAYDHDLLTVHMIQHLLLMTAAPGLILLGEPLLAFRYGLPRAGHAALHVLRRPRLRQVGQTLTRPTVCWIVSALALVGWHVPALFALAVHSEAWHSVEQSSFLA